jgi:hypothetical protein
MRILPKKEKKPDVLKGIVAGAAGGVAGCLLMDAFEYGLEALEKEYAGYRRRAQLPAGIHVDEEGYPRASASSYIDEEKDAEREKAGEKAAGAIGKHVFGVELSRQGQKMAAPAVDVAFGAMVGGAYGAAAEFYPEVTSAEGAPFGAGMMLIGEEVAGPAAGFSRWPHRKPYGRHAKALASYAIFGMTCEAVRGIVRDLLD